MLVIASSASGKEDAIGNSTKQRTEAITCFMKVNVKVERIMPLLLSRSTRNAFAIITISNPLSFASLEIRETL